MSQQSDNCVPIQFNAVRNHRSYLRELMKTMSNSGNTHFTVSTHRGTNVKALLRQHSFHCTPWDKTAVDSAEEDGFTTG
jgi:hypothetical protein